MRRRPSGSTSEEDQDPSSPNLLPPTTTTTTGHGDKLIDNQRGAEKSGRHREHTGAGSMGNAAAHLSSTGKVHHWETATPTNSTPRAEKEQPPMKLLSKDITTDSMVECRARRRLRWRNPWAPSLFTLATTLLAFVVLFVIVESFYGRQLDSKGCKMSYMRPSFVHFSDFDTEHTRFASKYSLYLYREGGLDEDKKVKGVPVLFIPGNAGSYKQVRPIAAEAAYYYHEELRHDLAAKEAGKRPLDFFSVDFNEDFTAFHGQTLLDQAEYLNDAITFILSLYHSPSRSQRDSDLPDPSSVIIVGHSMGGIVARTMLTMPNYQSNTINTIITLSAPHARPPVSFDREMVQTYKRVNDYWRHAYSQKWAVDNPLWHVTLISIAGGGLDTVVPSDYANLASIVPDTHGFTVFTTSMPNVWTGMDHLAIIWCDQVRKSIVRSLYDVINVTRPVQTNARADRMRGFKKWFLTGLEDVAERTLPHAEAKTLLTLEDDSNAIISPGERLVLRSLGQSKRKPKAYLLPVPPQGASDGKKFTLLTNQKLDSTGEYGKLEVLFCSVFPLQAGQSATLFSMNMDLSGDSSGSTRLACKNAASDVISLPASTHLSTQPFVADEQPFSYLQYELEELVEHQFVAIVDKSGEHSTGWVVAEFSSNSESIVPVKMSLQRLITTGLNMKLPAKRPLGIDIKIPALYSSLLAYKLHVGKQACDMGELFAPLLRQYISEVHESKFFVNVKDANINLHGVSPYMPPPFLTKSSNHGLSLQIWSDPTCDSSMEVSLKVDWLGSMGKLVMRYRLVFAAFPILVVCLVLRHQFKVYDESAIFMSFSEGLNECLRTSIPVAFMALTFLSISLAGANYQTPNPTTSFPDGVPGNTTDPFGYTNHELLLGSEDAFFWFLVPLFGLLSVGICVALNYVVLGLIYVLALLYSVARSSSRWNTDGRPLTLATFANASPRQRIITTGILVSLVSTVVPYHFVYMILCLVQVATCVRGYKVARDSCLDTSYNFYNYAHSILILMVWILPINVLVLVVWIRNLAVHWLTPFSTHHNILSILPFILLVETISTGRMIPRVHSRFRWLTSIFLFFIAAYAAIYGVTYAYILHHLANSLCFWLVIIHFEDSPFSLQKLGSVLQTMDPDGSVKKRP